MGHRRKEIQIDLGELVRSEGNSDACNPSRRTVSHFVGLEFRSLGG